VFFCAKTDKLSRSFNASKATFVLNFVVNFLRVINVNLSVIFKLNLLSSFLGYDHITKRKQMIVLDILLFLSLIGGLMVAVKKNQMRSKQEKSQRERQ
jgi:hypothetical protein